MLWICFWIPGSLATLAPRNDEDLGVADRITYFPTFFAQHLVLEAAWKQTAYKTHSTR
jgi:hypothetical protein